MADDNGHGQPAISSHGDGASDERVERWNPNYMTLREQAVNYPPEMTSPPAKKIPDKHMRRLALSCDACGQELNAWTKITEQDKEEITKRWNRYHSHTNDA